MTTKLEQWRAASRRAHIQHKLSAAYVLLFIIYNVFLTMVLHPFDLYITQGECAFEFFYFESHKKINLNDRWGIPDYELSFFGAEGEVSCFFFSLSTFIISTKVTF